jgi:PTH1 family peptidyl-tRNA hydrolase
LARERRRKRRRKRSRSRRRSSGPCENLTLKIIVGLGNPGEEYKNTRHNAGFAVVDALARAHRCTFTVRRCRSLIARTHIGDSVLVLVKPRTFVNLSGEAVECVLRMTESAPADLLVIADDASLPFGTVRIRARGSDGGHKGLRSIIAHVCTEEFARLRIGIGSEEMPEELTDFVLSAFSEDETDELPNVIERCCQAIETAITEGIEQAMNEFN